MTLDDFGAGTPSDVELTHCDGCDALEPSLVETPDGSLCPQCLRRRGGIE